jgi:hypothetical protein
LCLFITCVFDFVSLLVAILSIALIMINTWQNLYIRICANILSSTCNYCVICILVFGLFQTKNISTSFLCIYIFNTYTLVMTHSSPWFFAMALIEIDALPFMANIHGFRPENLPSKRLDVLSEVRLYLHRINSYTIFSEARPVFPLKKRTQTMESLKARWVYDSDVSDDINTCYVSYSIVYYIYTYILWCIVNWEGLHKQHW